MRRSEREKDKERERGAGGNHSNVSLYILRFVLLAGYANFRPHRYPSGTKVPSPLYTRSLLFSLSLCPSLALSVAIESEKFAKVRSRDAGVGVVVVVVGSVIKICASKQT